ncbi:hypothetical protein [Microbacterium maritypicum]|uniref:Uncharacterized protein n=1 Tax=Microbacterium maritypicum MF109 TaxID=1333857 RepID=T5KTN3_MICMQ|nr:hypothetical protein [Microbacterium liquefaciens]EQM83384.1 hypothetical protein L687_12245 [Microbacterium maritypicum MF109]
MSALIKGRRYVGATTGTRDGERFYRDVEFTASRDQEVEPFIRDRTSTPDQDRVFREYDNFGSVPMLVVAGSLREVTP